MTFAELVVKFGTQGADKLKSDVKEIKSGFESATKTAKDFAETVGSIATGNLLGAAIQSIAGGIVGLGKSLFEAGMNAESMDARFTAFGLNATKTREFLFKVSSASTLTSNQLNEMTLALQQSGFNIYAVIPRLAKWADAVGGGTEKLQGMVRFLNLLRSGVKPDQELLQSLGFSDVLVKAGLKFDQGKLQGDIRTAMEKVMAEIDRMTGPVAEQMSKTFEARFANLVDFFDKLKEIVGRELINIAGPVIDALNKTLGAVINSKVFKDAIGNFFKFGRTLTSNLSKGMDNPDAQKMMAKIIGTFLANFEMLPDRIKVFGMIIEKTFDFILAKFEQLNLAFMKIPILLKLPWQRTTEENALLNKEVKAPKLDLTTETFILDAQKRVADRQANEYTYRLMRQFQKGGLGLVMPQGDALLKNTLVGAGRDQDKKDKDKKDKDKKDRDNKQQKTLDKIADHTKTTAEMSLREFSYGGGILGRSAVNSVELYRRNIFAPATSVSSDFEKITNKAIRTFTNNNSLNPNFRRA